MSLPRPICPNHFHADLIWWDGPFNINGISILRIYCRANAQEIEEKREKRTRILYYGTVRWRAGFADLLNCCERFLVYSGGVL